MDEHISDLSASANQVMFALKTLQRSGLNDAMIWRVCQATLVSKLLYGCSAWWGFANKSQIDCVEGIIRRATRWNLYPENGPSILAMVEKPDNKLFNTILTNKQHVTQKRLAPVKITPYNLRDKAHDRILPLKTFTLSKNFIHRVLYSDMH